MTESVKRLEVRYDKDSINTIELVIHGESHMLANIVRDKILQNKSCTFCACKITHPSDDFVSIRVSATESMPVRVVIIESLEILSQSIENLINQIRIDQ